MYECLLRTAFHRAMNPSDIQNPGTPEDPAQPSSIRPRLRAESDQQEFARTRSLQNTEEWKDLVSSTEGRRSSFQDQSRWSSGGGSEFELSSGREEEPLGNREQSGVDNRAGAGLHEEFGEEEVMDTHADDNKATVSTMVPGSFRGKSREIRMDS